MSAAIFQDCRLGLPTTPLRAKAARERRNEFRRYTGQTACPPAEGRVSALLIVLNALELGDERALHLLRMPFPARNPAYKGAVNVEPISDPAVKAAQRLRQMVKPG
jgi:hypothetical protein